MADETPRQPVRLPLSASMAEGAGALNVTITEATIAKVVEEFYTACRADAVLGPVFAAHVHDWDAHLARIRSFWSSAILRTGTYAGRPLEAHLAIPGLAPAHFSIWLRLFRQTVERCCAPADAALFMDLAGRMANRIMAEAEVRKGR